MGNTCERVVFDEISAPQPANVPGKKLSRNLPAFLGTANLRNNSFLLTEEDHIHRMHKFLSETIFFQYNNPRCSSERRLEENSCSECLDKSVEVINEGFPS